MSHVCLEGSPLLRMRLAVTDSRWPTGRRHICRRVYDQVVWSLPLLRYQRRKCLPRLPRQVSCPLEQPQSKTNWKLASAEAACVVYNELCLLVRLSPRTHTLPGVGVLYAARQLDSITPT